MALIFDRRAKRAQPMTHALVIGVSDYRFLPGLDDPPDPKKFNLKRLASPALSAAKLAEWLVENCDALNKPLASCRLLISPSAQETPKLPAIPNKPGRIAIAPSPADWASLVTHANAWRDDASGCADDSTIFYFAGHGLQRLGTPLLTVEDFLDPAAGARLMRSVELQNIVNGMAPEPARQTIARSQYYLVDACQEEIEGKALQTSTGSIFEGLPGYDDRSTPIFFGSYAGGVAQALQGEPTDFCQALLNGLNFGAENRDASDNLRRWPVTTFTLHRAMANHFKDKASGQFAPLRGTIREETLRWLSQPPLVNLSILVDPNAAVEWTTIRLSGATVRETFTSGGARYPYGLPLPAGIYSLDATAEGGIYSDFSDQGLINQTNPRWTVRMVPR